jgi:hypothetical protein
VLVVVMVRTGGAARLGVDLVGASTWSASSGGVVEVGGEGALTGDAPRDEVLWIFLLLRRKRAEKLLWSILSGRGSQHQAASGRTPRREEGCAVMVWRVGVDADARRPGR